MSAIKKFVTEIPLETGREYSLEEIQEHANTLIKNSPGLNIVEYHLIADMDCDPYSDGWPTFLITFYRYETEEETQIREKSEAEKKERMRIGIKKRKATIAAKKLNQLL